MYKPTAARRRIWMAAGLVACLLCPTVLVADLVCDHCAGSPMGHDMKRARAAHHGVAAMEREDLTPASGDADCSGEGGCPLRKHMSPGVPQASGAALVSDLSFLALGADRDSAGEPVRVESDAPPVPAPRWSEGPPLFLAVASFLL